MKLRSFGMPLRSLNIALRAALGFTLVALLVVVLGGYALLQMATMQQASAEVDKSWLPSIATLGRVREQVMALQTVTARLLQQREESLN